MESAARTAAAADPAPKLPGPDAPPGARTVKVFRQVLEAGDADLRQRFKADEDAQAIARGYASAACARRR